MPDLRYHAVTLVGVFIALTVGLLLGIALAEGGTLEEQLQSQVREIRGDLERQRDLIAERDEEIADLRETAEADSELIEGLANATIPNRLEGRTVALVTGPWASGDASRDLQNDLAAAGADLLEPVNLQPPQGDDSPAELEALYAEAAREALRTPAEEQGETPDDEATTSTAEDDSFPDPDDGPDVVVFLGGGDPPDDTPGATLDAVAEAETAMFGVWSESGVEGGEDDAPQSEPPRIVAAETVEATRSEVGLFEEVGVASVDNADTPQGRAAVVVLAADDDGATGSYGGKDSASDLFPPPPPSSE